MSSKKYIAGSIQIVDGTQGSGKVLVSDSDGLATWISSYFIEAQNTTSPNATIPVDSLTALSATTDADVAIVTKGNGALFVNIPDNTSVGGNKRGINSVDFQMIRSTASQVASGNNSFIAGGINNTAIGISSHAEGDSTTAGWRGFTIDSIVGGTVSINSSYGDITTQFMSGYVYIYNGTDTRSYGYDPFDVIFISPNTIIQLGDTSINEFYAGDLAISDTDNLNNVLADIWLGESSHSEGSETFALGLASHAEGNGTKALGDYSHAEGSYTESRGNRSHAEGYGTIAYAFGHAEGSGTKAIGDSSHAENYQTIARGVHSHAEGASTEANGLRSHSEGWLVIASGKNSHGEGWLTRAIGENSHSQGYNTKAVGESSHAEGASTVAGWQGFSIDSIVGGTVSISSIHGDLTSYFTSGYVYINDYINNTIRYSVNSVLFTSPNTTIIQLDDITVNAVDGAICDINNISNPLAYDYIGVNNHAEGLNTKAIGDSSHAEGVATTSAGLCSHSEGNLTRALGAVSHAEGGQTTANGNFSHSEGYLTIASGDQSHAEGNSTIASGYASHAGGNKSSTKGISARYSIGSSNGGDVGSSQLSIASVTGNTAESAGAQMATMGGTIIALPLLDNEAVRVKGSILGKQSASINIAAYDFDCLIVRGVGVGTTVIRINIMTPVYDDITLTTLPLLIADTVNGGLSLKSGGKWSTDIKWSARLDSVEVINE